MPEDLSGELRHLAEFLATKQFDMIINLPMRGGGARRYFIINSINITYYYN